MNGWNEIDTNEAIAVVESDGFCCIQETSVSSENLLELAGRFGSVVPSRSNGEPVDELTIRNCDAGRESSLTASYGEGAFPFHTDTAYWTTPARFIALQCVVPGRATLLFDSRTWALDEGCWRDFENSVFAVKNGRHSFYGNCIAKDATTIRYDPACMTPKNSAAHSCEELLAALATQKHDTKRIDWEQGQIVLIDNWRMLHARSGSDDATVESPERKLYRVTIT
ncbi:MAG: TauD/TfdA family dioxygenase [Aureliella sp.]